MPIYLSPLLLNSFPGFTFYERYRLICSLNVVTSFLFLLQFSASGLMIIARNYLDVYPYDRWTAKVSIVL